jgi:hypothetical protein
MLWDLGFATGAESVSKEWARDGVEEAQGSPSSLHPMIQGHVPDLEPRELRVDRGDVLQRLVSITAFKCEFLVCREDSLLYTSPRESMDIRISPVKSVATIDRFKVTALLNDCQLRDTAKTWNICEFLLTLSHQVFNVI